MYINKAGLGGSIGSSLAKNASRKATKMSKVSKKGLTGESRNLFAMVDKNMKRNSALMQHGNPVKSGPATNLPANIPNIQTVKRQSNVVTSNKPFNRITTNKPVHDINAMKKMQNDEMTEDLVGAVNKVKAGRQTFNGTNGARGKATKLGNSMSSPFTMDKMLREEQMEAVLDGTLKSGNFSKNPYGATDADMDRMRMHDSKVMKQRAWDEQKAKGKEQMKVRKQEEKQLNRKRAITGATLGATSLYAGADAMNRYRNGGTITRNENNQRDVVGVPFL